MIDTKVIQKTKSQIGLVTDYAQRNLRMEFDNEKCALSCIPIIAMAERFGFKELKNEMVRDLMIQADFSQDFIETQIELAVRRIIADENDNGRAELQQGRAEQQRTEINQYDYERL